MIRQLFHRKLSSVPPTWWRWLVFAASPPILYSLRPRPAPQLVGVTSLVGRPQTIIPEGRGSECSRLEEVAILCMNVIPGHEGTLMLSGSQTHSSRPHRVGAPQCP